MYVYRLNFILYFRYYIEYSVKLKWEYYEDMEV